MNSYEVYYWISGLISMLGQLLMIVFAGIYFFKNKSIGPLLMVIGSLLLLISFIITPLSTAIIANRMGPEALVKTQGILGIVKSLFGLVFAIGFAISVLKATNQPKTS